LAVPASDQSNIDALERYERLLVLVHLGLAAAVLTVLSSSALIAIAAAFRLSGLPVLPDPVAESLVQDWLVPAFLWALLAGVVLTPVHLVLVALLVGKDRRYVAALRCQSQRAGALLRSGETGA
jgi:uncharacterized membrane protein YjjP (DUF1212 family)